MRGGGLAILATLCTFCLAGCGTTKNIPPTVIYRDSIKVEYRERIVRDTVDFVPPEFYASQTSCDTVSVIENDYAKTTAVWHDGLLSHNLQSKPTIMRVPVSVEVHDTLVFCEKGEAITRYVEVEKRLTKWQELKMDTGGAFMLGFLILATAFVACLLVGWRRRAYGKD